MVVRLRAARVLVPTGLVGPAEVVLDGDRIAAVELLSATAPDVPDVTVAPGFVDLQVNGVGDASAHDADAAAFERMGALLAAAGVTSWCPTLVTAPLDHYARPLAAIAAAQQATTGPRIVGAHLEGPFLGGRPGAHDADLIRAVDHAWLATLPAVVRLVTLAPEQEGVPDAIAALVARGVVASIGHSAATYEQAVAAVDAGATMATHVWNAMAAFDHRSPGIVGAALTDDRVVAGVIGDTIHVHATTLRLVARAKGPGGFALVSDTVDWLRRPTSLADGTLAGARHTIDRGVANLVRRCGIDLAVALAAASTTPARLLGLDDRGTVEAGLLADLVVLDAGLEVESTWLGGHRIYTA